MNRHYSKDKHCKCGKLITNSSEYCKKCYYKIRKENIRGQNNPNFKDGRSLNKRLYSKNFYLNKKLKIDKFCIDCGSQLTSAASIRCLDCYHKFILGKNSPGYIDGRANKKHYCIDCNKKISYQNWRIGTKRCASCAKKGDKAPKYIDGRTLKKYYCKDCGAELSNYKAKRCLSCRGNFFKGEKHQSWIDGRSYLEYPENFNNELKEYIRKRDKYKCQNCHKTQEQELKDINRKLSIHHIDYNKKNCVPSNLITTCQICNNIANSNRNYWINFYNHLLKCQNSKKL